VRAPQAAISNKIAHPRALAGLGLEPRTTVLTSIEDRIDEITSDADLDEEPDNHFKKLMGMLDRVEAIGVDDDASALIDVDRDQVKRSIETLEARKREGDEEVDDDTDRTHVVTQKKEEPPVPAAAVVRRSVFDHVDK
jgi:hypothetical protein